MVGNSDDETNFPQKILLTNWQVANLRKGFANYLSTDTKLSKAQLSKMIQQGGFLGRLLGLLLKTGVLLMNNLIKPLAKSLLIPLGLNASAADPGKHKKILGSTKRPSHNRTLIVSNHEMKNIIKIVKSLEDCGLLLKWDSKTIQNEAKEQKGRFLSMLLGILGAVLLANILAGKGINWAAEGIARPGYGNKQGKGTIAKRQGRKTVRAGHENKMNF